MHATTSKPNPATAAGTPAGASTARALEFLAFTLGQEEYGIDIQKVQELRGYDTVTRIANAPEHIKGVVNLRGIIVPIIDMRIKFNLGTPTYDQFTVVIILEHGQPGHGHGGGQRLGRDHLDARSNQARAGDGVGAGHRLPDRLGNAG